MHLLSQSGPTADTFTESPIKIFIVDDHTLFRQGFRRILESSAGNLRVVGEAPNGSEAIQLVEALRPDIIFMDISMPQMNGLEATRQITEMFPSSHVILLTMYEDPFIQEEGRKAGASGFLLKKSVDREVFESIQEVISGRSYFTTLKVPAKEDRSKGLPSFDTLSSREKEILRHLANGMSNREIAPFLGISINTVETHRKNLMKKLKLHNMSEIIRYALLHGLISL